MSENSQIQADTSEGHRFSDEEHLDGHFSIAYNAYESLLRAVQIQAGWHILDAGCGTGAFLPLISELVGARGQISAVDVDAENVALAQARVSQAQLQCPTKIEQGDLLDLPYKTNAFDAVWCANVSQYLDDNNLSVMLEELMRVVRPGGLVAIKETDITAMSLNPPGPRATWRLYETWQGRGDAYLTQLLRAPELPVWLSKSGLTNVHLESVFSVASQPLSPKHKTFLAGVCIYHSQEAAQCDLSESDTLLWQQVGEVNSADHILNNPDFYYREANIVVIGQVPE
ncbi:MAG: class I SAM-dependent methyltransferase [Caldilineaceae bacterium]|nr:class I SAM-dependent methyltransferase [Caldilineaceae bacterium]MCB9150417.1 class I SAM-dependent methyltransferase [Caldilineaceae bacterium]